MPRKVVSQKDKDDYIKMVNAVVNKSGANKFSFFEQHYGLNGKLNEGYVTDNPKNKTEVDRYNNVTLEKPPKLTDQQVIAVTLGNILEPDRYNDPKLNAGIARLGEDEPVSPFDAHSTMVVEDVNTDFSRTAQYLPILADAREKTKTGLEYVKRTGRLLGIDKPLKNIVDYALNTMATYTGEKGLFTHDYSAFSNTKMVCLLAKDVMDSGLLSQDYLNKYDQKDRLKLEALSKEVQAAEDAAKIKKQLLEGNIQAGSNERKQLAEDLIFNSLLAELTRYEESALEKNSENILDDFYIKMGIDRNDREQGSAFREISFEDNSIDSNALIGIQDAYKKYTISDLKAILAQPDGVAQLRNLYSKAIKKSQQYKDLVNASQDELVGAMMDVDQMADSKSFSNFPDVDLPETSKQYNVSFEKELKANIDKHIKKCEQKNYALLQGRDKNYCLKSLDSEGLANNYRAINSIGLVSKNKITTNTKSKEYRDYMTSLSNLHEFAKGMDEEGFVMTNERFQEYKKLLLDAIRKIQVYIDSLGPVQKAGKTDALSIKTAGQMKRALNANLISADNAYKALYNEKVPNPDTKYKKDVNEINNQIDEYIKATIGKAPNAFLQGKYKGVKYKEVRNPNSYSIYRTAAQSITLMALAAQNKKENGAKYTIDDLYDDTKFVNEKSAMFDKVVDAISRGSAEDQKWIAEMIFDGELEMGKLLNDKALKIDFSNPDMVNDPEFRKLAYVAQMQFDAWQEMSHCQNEIIAYAHDHDASINNYDDLKIYVAKTYDSVSAVTDVIKNQNEALIDYANGGNGKYHQIIDAGLTEHMKREFIRQSLSSGKKLDEIFDFKAASVFSYTSSNVLKKLFTDIKDRDADPEIKNMIVSKAIDNSLFKDLKVKFDFDNPNPNNRVVFTGVPTLEDLRSELEYQRIPEQIRENSYSYNLKRLEQMKEKTAPQNQPIINKAISAYTQLHEFINSNNSLKGENKEHALGLVRSILKAEMLPTFEKTGLASERLDEIMDKTIDDMKLLKSPDDYLSIEMLGSYAHSNRASEIVKSKQAVLDNIIAEGLYTKNYEEMEKADAHRDQVLKESIFGTVEETLDSFNSAIDGVGEITTNDELYNSLVADNENAYRATAFDGGEEKQTNEPVVRTFVNRDKRPVPVINQKKYKEYAGKVNEYISDIEGIIENEVREGRLSDMAGDYLKSLGPVRLRRALRGFGDDYFTARTPILEGLKLINASTVAQVNDGLNEKINKWNDKFPVYEISIEGEKQLDTLADYWEEQERGVITPEREAVYRDELYAQTNNLIALCDKLDRTAENAVLNPQILSDRVFLNNDPFEAHSSSARGVGPLAQSLKAYKFGLENGWPINDLGALAAFAINVNAVTGQTLHNNATELSKYEKYDEPRYKDNEHKEYVEKINKYYDKLKVTPLKDNAMRKKQLDEMQKLIDEGKQKGYISTRYSEGFKQEREFADRNTRMIEVGKTNPVHSMVSPDVFTKGSAKADWTFKNAQLSSIINKFNTARTDGYWSKESPVHKTLREAASGLQDSYKKMTDALALDSKKMKVSELADVIADHLGKIDEVILASKAYQKDRAGASSTGGISRLEGAKELEEFAKKQRSEVVRQLKKKGLIVDSETLKDYRLVYAIKKNDEALEYINSLEEMPATQQGKDMLMDKLADVMVYRFATSETKANKDAFENLGQARLKNELLKDKDFTRLANGYLNDKEMTPEKLYEELQSGEAMSKMNNINKKYSNLEKQRVAENAKRQEKIKERNTPQI